MGKKDEKRTHVNATCVASQGRAQCWTSGMGVTSQRPHRCLENNTQDLRSLKSVKKSVFLVGIAMKEFCLWPANSWHGSRMSQHITIWSTHFPCFRLLRAGHFSRRHFPPGIRPIGITPNGSECSSGSPKEQWLHMATTNIIWGQCKTELLTPLAHELLVTLVPGSGLVSEIYRWVRPMS